LQNGHRYLSAYPFESDARIGRIILTVFSNQKQFDLKIDPAQFIDIGRRLHRSFKNNGQLKDYFGIEEKEQLVLSRMADGKTAADIAQELDVTVRTIEMRLQNARKKLKARTTTEAVYKSVAYGILPI
jgi:DNA-binding NarL/FixJ family response regulator